MPLLSTFSFHSFSLLISSSSVSAITAKSSLAFFKPSEGKILKTKQARPQWRLLGGESAVEGCEHLLLLLFFWPGTQFPGNEKIMLYNTNILIISSIITVSERYQDVSGGKCVVGAAM